MPDDIPPVQTAPAEGSWAPPSRSRVVTDSLAAAVMYFAIVLAVVGLLGPLREFSVDAGADPLLASLAEATAVALAMTYGSLWATRVFSIPRRPGARLIVGVGAMGLFCASAGAALLFTGVSGADAWAQLTSPPGAVALLTIALGAVLPLALARG